MYACAPVALRQARAKLQCVTPGVLAAISPCALWRRIRGRSASARTEHDRHEPRSPAARRSRFAATIARREVHRHLQVRRLQHLLRPRQHLGLGRSRWLARGGARAQPEDLRDPNERDQRARARPRHAQGGDVRSPWDRSLASKLLWRLALRARQVDWWRAGSDRQDHWHPMCAQTIAKSTDLCNTQPSRCRRAAWQMRQRASWRSTQQRTR